MKNKALFFLVMPFVFIYLTGCAALIVGGAVGALGGYAISKDTIQGDTDKPYDSLWYSAQNLSTYIGIIRQQNETRGYIQFDSGSSKVYVRLIKLTRTATRLRVSARKYHLPNLNLAEDIFIKIMEGAGNVAR